MKHYQFNVTLAGYGNTPQEAWDDAVESFNQDAGATPEEYTEEEEDEVEYYNPDGTTPTYSG